ncbi:MAG: tetratricopeptide repeat protein [Acidobacteriota bacterium]|nr:tetratricopeptide repeat protein [Acidobacteriota bacterium]
MHPSSTETTRGLSLSRPFVPADKAERDRLIRGFVCLACGDPDARFFADAGLIQTRGALMFSEIFKECACGFKNRLFFVVNDLSMERSEQIIPSQKALMLAREQGLLEDPGYHESQARLALAEHAGDLDRALEIAEDMVLDFRDDAAAWYNLGWFLGEKGRYREALAAYDKAGELNPHMADAWYNKAIVCARMGLYTEARLCMERCLVLRPDLEIAGVEACREIAGKEGMFDRVAVLESVKMRKMMIGNQVQGGAFNEPDAPKAARGVEKGPGPVPESIYTLAWLIPGQMHPDARVLMLGLGCGIGAVMLLRQFPAMRVEAVEADPVVIDLSRRYFPLVAHYLKEGRLVIHHAEAVHFCREATQTYDFVLHDLYRGLSKVSADTVDADFIDILKRLAPATWINLVGRLDRPYLQGVMRTFRDTGLPFAAMFPLISPQSWGLIDSNWVLATEAPDFSTVAPFIPFQEFDPPAESVSMMRAEYKMMTERAWNRKQIDDFLDSGNLPGHSS